MRFWPRTIRWQMVSALVVLEVLSVGLFTSLLVRQQMRDFHLWAETRLAYEASAMAMQAREALIHERPGWVGFSVNMTGEAPTISQARVTDEAGNILFSSQGDLEQDKLSAGELAQIPRVRRDEPLVFVFEGGRWGAVRAIYTGDDLRGYAWVEYDKTLAHKQLRGILSSVMVFAVVWIAASVLLVLQMFTSISQPLRVLHRGTRELMRSPEKTAGFPLPVGVQNELGELIMAFNGMVASIAEQRAELNDTLSMLDSMLAHAPIGRAFIDTEGRFVRVNQVFADMTGVPLSRYLGRTIAELLPAATATQLDEAVRHVFVEQEAVKNLELSGDEGPSGRPWTWLASAYPVLTLPRTVRWVGIIVLDATERKRTEEALRKAEKLAVTGRLAASIAHEINNPLEATTNLLFLLQNYCDLDEPAKNYVAMAEYEVRRISEITQQMLRFYKQTTLPGQAKMAELLDSVLSLYQGRLKAMSIQTECRYDPELELRCFAGEIRQVIANLVGNAIEASTVGGYIEVRARRSRSWLVPELEGVRFTVADKGIGMDAEVRSHIFDAFYTTKKETGTGLGLWISQEIIEKHLGLIRLRSRMAVNGGRHGTVFQFFIPDLPAKSELPAEQPPASSER